MKAADIVAHMMEHLPRHTDKVTTTVGITNMTVAGTIVTATTDAAHGLSVANSVLISDTKLKTPITSLTYSGLVASAVTSADHDLTKATGQTETCEIIGADQTDYNGTFDLLSVANRKNFTYQLDSTPAATPATGTIFSIRDRIDGFNGGFVVTEVPDTTSFKYDLGFTPPGDAEFTSGLAHTEFRILPVITQPTAENEYTKRASQGDYFVFVQLGDANVSRSRNTTNDQRNSQSRYSDKRLSIIQPVSVYAFVPSKDDLGGASIRDDIEDFAIALYKTLEGWLPPTDLSSSSEQVLNLTGHRGLAYTGSLYIHQFEFEGREDLDIEDSYQVLTRAFRDATITTNNSFGVSIATVTADLDEDPL